VTIGKNCLIGNYALIMDSDYHSLNDRSLPGEAAPIEICDDAWIATRAIVLKGVRIGAGAVVAAGAVVTEDVPPRTLVAGVPAKVVRSL
jgi:acetyltransferase-like isoleucine patch superfamily enzyme